MPNLRLSAPITEVSGVGPAKAKLLKKLKITRVRDLLFDFPRRYEDFSQVTPIRELQLGKPLTVKGRVKSVKSDWGFRGPRRLLRIYVEIEDATGILHVTWYNLRFLEKQLTLGREIYVAGTVEAHSRSRSPTNIGFAMRSPALEFVGRGDERTHTAAITPVYSETQGVTSRFIRYQVKNLLPLVQSIPEYIPEDIVGRNKLLNIHTALRAIHFPKSQAELEAAQRRLRFDELFFLQLAALVRRQYLQRADSHAIEVDYGQINQFVDSLPFSLTGAQEQAWREILPDIAEPHPMNRLLQGDVGSGKSVVALLTARATLAAGYKVLYLAPTEILARQQVQYFTENLPEYDVRLLIGATEPAEKKETKQQMLALGPCCVVGTHALLQADVGAQKVGLAIIDEQHRFGVAQRSALRKIQPAIEPHLLSMTATPIPRTLNLTVYGDLDVSVLDEVPPGRKAIVTKLVAPAQRDEAIIHVLSQLHDGRQGYVIAPLVEESEKLQLKSATATYEEMKKLFPGIAVGLLHGQMASAEKESVMRNFVAGAIQLLVATAVVEVGVHVPNAAVMIIEGAERFGLAQLHQFRGRIGRAEHQSYCYLFPTTNEAAANERLKVLAATNDGFKIAEEDLRLRGPGEVYGLAQSGFSDLKVASLLDYATIKLARTEAERILKQDPELAKYPILQGKVRQKNIQTHLE